MLQDFLLLCFEKEQLDQYPGFKCITLDDLNVSVSSKSKESSSWHLILGNNSSDRIDTTVNGELLLNGA